MTSDLGLTAATRKLLGRRKELLARALDTEDTGARCVALVMVDKRAALERKAHLIKAASLAVRENKRKKKSYFR